MQEARGGHPSTLPWRARRAGWSAAALALGTVAFAVAPAGASAQGRGYELVSPVEKNLGDTVRVSRLASDGETVAFGTMSRDGETTGISFTNWVVARRTANGWLRSEANPKSVQASHTSSPTPTFPAAWSADFSKWVANTPVRFSLDDLDIVPDTYLVDAATGVTTFLSHSTLPDTGGQSLWSGGTADLSLNVFEVRNRALLPGMNATAVYQRVGDTLTPVSILPDGTPINGSSSVATDPGARSTLEPNATVSLPYGGAHAVSDDGSRIFWVQGTGGVTGGALYVRINGTETRPLSVSKAAGADDTVWPGTFIAATRDGRTAWFRSFEQLTDDATVGGGIYRINVDTGDLKFLTPETDPPDPGNPQGSRITRAIASDDGSRLYVMADGILADGATDSANNAYVITGDEVEFIATVDGGDRFVRSTRDGRYALLSSVTALNGADPNGHRAFYRYDAVTKSLDCVSCRADGSPSQGDANLDAQPPGSALGQDVTTPRNLTTDGDVFFATADRLVPEDLTPATDVYEFDGETGDVSLLTSGRSDYDSYMGENSDDGRDVFVMTREAMVPNDTDGGLLDLYDVRRGGGFPYTPPPPPPTCAGEGCQNPATAAPSLPQPGSALSFGPGNIVPDADEDTDSGERRFKLATLKGSTIATQLARGRVINVPVTIWGGGEVSVKLTGRVRGRTRTLGSAKRTIRTTRNVKANVSLRLSSFGRRELRRVGQLSARLSVQVEGVDEAQTKSLTLKAVTK